MPSSIGADGSECKLHWNSRSNKCNGFLMELERKVKSIALASASHERSTKKLPEELLEKSVFIIEMYVVS